MPNPLSDALASARNELETLASQGVSSAITGLFSRLIDMHEATASGSVQNATTPSLTGGATPSLTGGATQVVSVLGTRLSCAETEIDDVEKRVHAIEERLTQAPAAQTATPEPSQEQAPSPDAHA